MAIRMRFLAFLSAVLVLAAAPVQAAEIVPDALAAVQAEVAGRCKTAVYGEDPNWGRIVAAAVILAHNHPSGDTTPSREDKEITKRLREAGDILGIKVLDHVIVDTDSGISFSFVESGLL